MPQAPLRLFVALYPPADVAAALLQQAAKLCGPGHRITPLPQVHLTALFIGDTDPRQLKKTTESVERAAAGIAPFDLTFLDLITLPEGASPRLMAARTNSPSPLLELHKRLGLRLARKAGKRDRFLPHVTLMRFGPGKVSPLEPDEAPLKGIAMHVDSVALIQSRLRPDGAEHVELRRCPLG